MPGVNFPDNLGMMFNDLERRIRVLENTGRNGIGSAISARATAAAAPTVFGAYEFGSAGNTWTDDAAPVPRTGSGYPKVTITATSRMLILWGARPISLASSPTFRSNTVDIAVRYTLVSTGGFTDSNLLRRVGQSNTGPTDMPVFAAKVQPGFATGYDYTFQLEANWTDTVPAAANQPVLTDSYLIVIPLSAA